MSKQLDLIKEAYAKHKDVIDAYIIAVADKFVGEDLDTSYAYTMMFDDGCLDAFSNCYEPYLEYVAEYGNDDDDAEFAGQVWIDVLRETGDDKYEAILARFVDIQENGL
jgi:hypothetical protein